MHLLSSKQIESPGQLSNLFKEANFLRHDPWSRGVDPVTLARGFVLAIVKDEGSTRTRISFEVAMKKLGGDTVFLELDKNSSVSKGESIEDTIRTISEYSDAIVMRHSQKGMVAHCAKFSSVPVINAGDGDGEHPTQALLDIYTIDREAGRLSNLNIMFVGDLKCSRTVHSLISLLSLYPYNTFHLVSPPDMKLPTEYMPLVGNCFEEEDLSHALKSSGGKIDILYMTRLQCERRDESRKDCYYKLDGKDIDNLGPNCRVLHPLPRNGEIPTMFDQDYRAAYFRQVKNGMFVRMALLNSLIHGKDFFKPVLTSV